MLSRLYIHMNEKQQNLLSKTKFIKKIKNEIIPIFFEENGIPLETKIKWSNKAGCGCGCSPGFIISNRYNIEYFVSVELDEKDPEFSNIV